VEIIEFPKKLNESEAQVWRIMSLPNEFDPPTTMICLYWFSIPDKKPEVNFVPKK